MGPANDNSSQKRYENIKIGSIADILEIRAIRWKPCIVAKPDL